MNTPLTDINEPPLDCITRVQFSPTQGESLLVASSWDGSLRMYDCNKNAMPIAYGTNKPILDCCFMADSRRVVFGGLSTEVRIFGTADSSSILLGKHTKAVRTVCYHKDHRIFTGGWDMLVKGWDPRSPQPTSTTSVGHKVFCMDCNDSKVLIGTSNKEIVIFDVRNMAQPWHVVEPLKYQLRSVKCFPDQTGFAASSVEGRVAWEYFANPSPKPKYAFKCHREPIEGVEHVYPVNALAFHSKYGTFATGGGDGTVSIWDGMAKKRLSRVSKQSVGVSALSFSADGTVLALGLSYTFEEDEKEQMPPNAIRLRHLQDNEVRPKNLSSG